jgi:glycine cleavage system aminomethyltransferase T
VPEVKFFHMTWMKIAGRDVRALRHGMAGQAGFELFGAWKDLDVVLETVVKAGEEFGLRLSGGRAYSSNTLESGWIPCPLPAIFTGESMRPYREWLPANSFEGKASLGGSYAPARIEDCYLTPWDLGYGPFVKFDHDFIGREALEKMAGESHRKKVTLALEDDDVLKVIASSLFQKEGRAKFMEFPSAVYSLYPYDKVTAGGREIGISTWVGYSYNQAKMLTLAMVDEEFASPGTEVTLVWGEECGGTAKPRVERHVQTEIRAIVSAVPYAAAPRQTYADAGWRKASA